MDSAEAWLSEHDPDYAETKQDWKHVTTGRYEVPKEESLHDETQESVYELLELGAEPVKGVPRRACECCGLSFEAERRDGNGQRFCTEKCQWRYKKRRQRRGNVPG
jgi:predicted nucleic acid-binding Zn ribbon protein